VGPDPSKDIAGVAEGGVRAITKIDTPSIKMREIHRKDAKSAKKGDEPAHNPLTIRFMPSLILGTFQFTKKPSRCPESFRYVSNWAS